MGIHELLHGENHEVSPLCATDSDSAGPHHVVGKDRNTLAPVRICECHEAGTEMPPFLVVDVVISVTLCRDEAGTILDNREISSHCSFRSPDFSTVSVGVRVFV